MAAEIFNSKIPIISAVGHETDTTIADFVADLRAPTPSAAAELATPEKLMLLETLENYEAELFSGVQKNFNAMQKKIDDVTNRLNSLSIEHKVDIYTIKLNKFSKELSAFFCKIIAEKQSELDVISTKLSQLSPSKILALGYSMAYKNGLIATSVKQFSTGDELLIKFSDGEALVKVDKVKLAKEKSDAI
ncbi:MAG: exodeoxyribonuclease VII large subunit [Oscillospiraceae bacterium]